MMESRRFGGWKAALVAAGLSDRDLSMALGILRVTRTPLWPTGGAARPSSRSAALLRSRLARTRRPRTLGAL
jgi:hypothetical protein